MASGLIANMAPTLVKVWPVWAPKVMVWLALVTMKERLTWVAAL